MNFNVELLDTETQTSSGQMHFHFKCARDATRFVARVWDVDFGGGDKGSRLMVNASVMKWYEKR